MVTTLLYKLYTSVCIILLQILLFLVLNGPTCLCAPYVSQQLSVNCRGCAALNERQQVFMDGVLGVTRGTRTRRKHGLSLAD